MEYLRELSRNWSFLDLNRGFFWIVMLVVKHCCFNSDWDFYWREELEKSLNIFNMILSHCRNSLRSASKLLLLFTVPTGALQDNPPEERRDLKGLIICFSQKATSLPLVVVVTYNYHFLWYATEGVPPLWLSWGWPFDWWWCDCLHSLTKKELSHHTGAQVPDEKCTTTCLSPKMIRQWVVNCDHDSSLTQLESLFFQKQWKP